MFLLGLVGLSGCSADEPSPAPEHVTFRVALAPQTRATFGDSRTASLDRLQWSVFEVGRDGSLTYVADGSAAAFADGSSLETTVSIPLVTGHTYRVAFCADNAASRFATFAAGKLHVDYSGAASNDADADCFTGLSTDVTVTGATSQSVTLSRPFAQLNWGTGDLDNDAVKKALPDLKARVTVSAGLFATYDVVTGTVSDPVSGPVTFADVALSALPDADFPVSGYRLLAMNYLLTGNGTINCAITVTNTAKTGDKNSTTATVSNAPVKVNFRTNIYGNILTTSGNINAGIDPGFNGDINIEI